MKTSSFYLAVAIVIACCCIPISSGATKCHWGYMPIASSCFLFISSRLTWEEARQQCENVGAHLAVLDTVSKRDSVINFVKNQGAADPYYWLDGREPWDDGRWIWFSRKTPVDQNLWLPGEPNEYNSRQEGCMHIWEKNNQFGINDTPCRFSNPFICEIDIDGNWGDWTTWSTCSATCGSQSRRSRTRVCDNPAPVSAGKPCPGDNRQTEFCFPGECPVDGVWSVWTHWSTCSKTCGQGNRTRHRACNSPPPTNGGKDCPGQLVEVETCSGPPCTAKLCPDLFIEVTDSLCLYISDPKTEAYNYFLSMKACASLSPLSRLMTMRNKYEYQNMVRFLPTAAEYWIGDDTTSSSNARTKLGSGSFGIWAAGYPSSRSLTGCVELSGKSGAFLWQDAPCWERKPFICELRPKDTLAPVVG
ncbi:SCO-spondin [Lingula anatina]|uniref:SCO-spondin n=1 Tax=Lingula anatina TaxID=7574 RepID=A0A1S3JIL4_LINAN|nr:SCO-spondin [Lingula anatina]|eukprot:XP_013410232.1 SCO-spondin [Lingula anatina]